LDSIGTVSATSAIREIEAKHGEAGLQAWWRALRDLPGLLVSSVAASAADAAEKQKAVHQSVGKLEEVLWSARLVSTRAQRENLSSAGEMLLSTLGNGELDKVGVGIEKLLKIYGLQDANPEGPLEGLTGKAARVLAGRSWKQPDLIVPRPVKDLVSYRFPALSPKVAGPDACIAFSKAILAHREQVAVLKDPAVQALGASEQQLQLEKLLSVSISSPILDELRRLVSVSRAAQEEALQWDRAQKILQPVVEGLAKEFDGAIAELRARVARKQEEELRAARIQAVAEPLNNLAGARLAILTQGFLEAGVEERDRALGKIGVEWLSRTNAGKSDSAGVAPASALSSLLKSWVKEELKLLAAKPRSERLGAGEPVVRAIATFKVFARFIPAIAEAYPEALKEWSLPSDAQFVVEGDLPMSAEQSRSMANAITRGPLGAFSADEQLAQIAVQVRALNRTYTGLISESDWMAWEPR
jgi:hypothetical protein